MPVLFWGFAAFLPSGCAAYRYQPADRLDAEAMRASCLSRINDRLPSSCRLTQRILVSFGRKDFDMTGYLLIRPDGSWLGVTLGDMGIELFRFEYSEGRGKITAQPPSFPLNPLYDGIIGDIQHLFGRKRPSDVYIVQRGESVVGLVMQLDDGDLEEYQFSRSSGSLVRSLGVSGGRIVREAVYHEPTAYPGLQRPLPREIVLNNHRWHYSMEIMLLDVQQGQ